MNKSLSRILKTLLSLFILLTIPLTGMSVGSGQLSRSLGNLNVVEASSQEVMNVSWKGSSGIGLDGLLHFNERNIETGLMHGSPRLDSRGSTSNTFTLQFNFDTNKVKIMEARTETNNRMYIHYESSGNEYYNEFSHTFTQPEVKLVTLSINSSEIYNLNFTVTSETTIPSALKDSLYYLYKGSPQVPKMQLAVQHDGKDIESKHNNNNKNRQPVTAINNWRLSASYAKVAYQNQPLFDVKTGGSCSAGSQGNTMDVQWKGSNGVGLNGLSHYNERNLDTNLYHGSARLDTTGSPDNNFILQFNFDTNKVKVLKSVTNTSNRFYMNYDDGRDYYNTYEHLFTENDVDTLNVVINNGDNWLNFINSKEIDIPSTVRDTFFALYKGSPEVPNMRLVVRFKGSSYANKYNTNNKNRYPVTAMNEWRLSAGFAEIGYHNKPLFDVKKNTECVFPTTCPVGLIPVGTPGTSSFFCKQNVTTKEDININIGDITNDLTGKDFGGSTNHNSSLVINGGNGNSNQTINGLQVKDNNFINFTNVPIDGKVTSLTNIWKPEFTVTINGKILKAPKPTDATQLQQYDLALSEFTSQAGADDGSNHTMVETILYKVNSVNELETVSKDKESLISIFNKNSNGEYLKKEQIKYSSINKKGLVNYDNFQTNQEGLYLLATKYVDQSKAGTLADKTTYTFKPIEIRFLNTLGYLPLSNYVAGQVNDVYMSVGLKKKDHGLSNLKYSNDSKTYKSMKVPSSHNYKNNHSLLGSTNGGISLVDNLLNKIPITSTTVDLADIKVSDIIDNGGGFFISSDKGVSYLDVDTKTVSSTSVTNGILDIEVINDTLYTLSEDKLMVYFIVGRELIPSNKVYDLTGLFSSNKKPGKFEIIGGVLTVSTVDEGSESEVIFLTDK